MTLPPETTQERYPSEEMRKAFEHWYSDAHMYPSAIARAPNGNYLLMGATAAWDAWQAAWKCRGEQDALICESMAQSPALTPIEKYRAEFCASAIRHQEGKSNG